MRNLTRYSIISRISGALAGLWLCSAGTAWAGGGADFASLSDLLTNTATGICAFFKISSCPTVPSVTQAALQVAALGNNLPEMLLRQNQFTPASRMAANNPPAVPHDDYGVPTGVGIPFPLDNSTTVPPLFIAATPGKGTTPPTPASGLLSNLTPLAFISQPSGTAPVTLLSDPKANSFFYAVALSSKGVLGTGEPLPTPDYVYFFYDDLSRFNVSFTMGTTIAKFTFPLRVLTASSTGGFTERAVPTTLNLVADSGGDCSNSNVVGDFNGMGTSKPLLPEEVGIDCQVVLSASPASTQQHAIFEVKVPLLVTNATDPLYFYGVNHNSPKSSAINSPQAPLGVYTAFQNDTAPIQPPTGTILGPGIAIGLAPSAAPLCSDLSVACPVFPPAPPIQVNFPLCANLPTKTTSNSPQLQPSVGAFFAMATSGETLLSAALGSASTSTCPAF